MKGNPRLEMSMRYLAHLLVFVAACVVFCGCDDLPKDKPVEIHGYQCNQCKAKFYTADASNAQQCPECKNAGIDEVVTYTCKDDNEKNVAVRTRAGVHCAKCGKILESFSYPSEADLKTWGAIKKSKKEVGSL